MNSLRSLRKIGLLAVMMLAFGISAFAQNVNVTSTAGTPAATYATLGAAFAAVNAGTHQGDVVMNVVLSTTETGPAVLNSGDATPAAYTSVLIQPTVDGVTVAGPTIAGRGLIELNGADNVTINGDNPNTTGTNRNLTITNTAVSTTLNTSVIRIALATTIVTSANNNAFRNLILNGSATGLNVAATTSTTGPANASYGIIATGNASTISATAAPAPITSVSTTIGAGATATNLTIQNNAVGTAARAITIQGSATTVFPGLLIEANTVGNATLGAANQVSSFGIAAQGSANAIIRANVVYVESFLGTGVRGIEVGNLSAAITGALIERNQVNRTQNSTSGGQGAFGISLAGGNGHRVVNNFVSGVINVANATFSTGFAAFGIRVASGTGHFVYHNSVNMYGNLTGTGSAQTAAFSISGTGLTGIDVRNNIFANTQTQSGATTPASSAFVSLNLPPGGSAAMNLTLNNNAYYFGAAANQGIAQVSTTSGSANIKTISELREYTRTLSAAGTNDSNSFASTAPAPFVSNIDLHIVAGSTTGLESGGAAVGVTTDIDNEARPNGTAPDIGADEFVGTFADQVAPTITYTPLPNTASTANRTLTVNVTDNIGVTDVRIYFRKTGGAYASTQCTPSGGTAQNGTYTCTIDYSLIGGAVVGDIIEYFVVAQDAAGNVVSNPAAGFTGTSTTNVTTPPTTPRSYTIAAAFPTTVTVGTGGTYTSLTNPGGLFAALNAGVVTGNVTVEIISDLTGETGAVALNPLTEEGAGAGTFTLTIKPSGAARTITGAAPFAIIRLNGADRVTIDGSLNGGTDRSLTITNTTTTTSGVIVIGSLGAGAGAINDTVKNCVLQAGTVGSLTSFTFGVFAGNANGAAVGPDNDNLTIQNNLFVRMRTGIQAVADATGQNDGLQIVGNTFGDAVTATNTIGRTGMNVSFAVNPTISQNTILNIYLGVPETGTGSGNPFGIIVSSLTGGTITQNTIDGMRSIGTSASLSPFGILAQTSTGVSVSQNTVKNITANQANPFGITLGFNLLNSTATRNNVTNIAYTGTGGFGGKGIDINTGSATSNLTVANNFVSDIKGDAFGTGFINDTIIGMRVTGTTGGVNLYFNSVNLGSGGFASTQTNTVTTALLVGASATALDVRNNIFANNLDNTTITTDKNYAIYSDAPATAYTTIDFNDYFVSGPAGVLGFIAAADRPTLADIQTGFGGNLNSKNVDPLFVSSTDLHLQATSPLINMGTPITAVTDDIDGQARGLAPEIGADEIVQAGTLALSAATYTVNEGAGTVTITVNRTGGSDGAVTVPYTLTDGTATGGAACGGLVDYVNTGNTVSFAAGQTTQTFTVAICDDMLAEGDETFNVLLGTATGGATTGTQATAVVTITDNDMAPTLAIDDVTMIEGNAGTTSFVFTVTRSGATGAAASVNYTTVDGSATVADNDYVLNTGTLNFAIGDSTKQITVIVNGDTKIEPTETFTVLLSNAMGATITDDTGLGTITNDDSDTTPPTVVITQAAGQTDPTTATTVNFTVTFSEPVTGFGAEAGDVVVSGTAFMGSTPTVVVSGSGTTYNVAVSGYNQNGTVIITIPAGAAQDAGNNGNIASDPAQGDNTVTVFPGATTLYVDDDGMAGPGGCNTAVTGVSTIQAAVDASASGNTIQVCPGTYPQNVTVDKPLTIVGPNDNIDPNTGTRVPEAILLTTVSNPVNNNCAFNTDSNIITVTAENVVIRGFTLDGDNQMLTSTFNFNGANIDAYSAVYQQNVNNPNADVSFNIVKNTSEFGIILGSNDTASARTNSTISRNKLDNIVGFCFGEAIRIGENAYANVANNVVTRSFNGVTIENFNNSPTSRPTSTIGPNQITAFGYAIYHNLHYSYTGNGFTISNNRINSYVQLLPPAFARSNNRKALGAGEQPSGGGGGGSAFDKFRGVMLESIQGQVPVTLNANEIIPERLALIAAGYTRVDGIYITNTSTVSPNILITGNQISRAFRGISHVAPAVPTLMCNAIAGNDVGLYVGTDAQFGGTPSSSTNGINVSQNNFTFNTAFGLQNDSSFMVVAENNYWNSPTGPTTPANPGGTGDRVSPNVDFAPFATAPTCGPTASGATLEGRVQVATGKGIVNTKLTLTDSAGRSLTVLTDKTGKFIFTEVPTGETYILSIHSKKYRFAEPTRVITVNENLNGIDFTAN